MPYAYSTERLLEILGPEVETEGSYNGKISGIAALSEASRGDLSFLGNAKYRSQVAGCKASVLLLPQDYNGVPQENQLFIRIPNPSFGLALICRDIEMTLLPRRAPGVHPSAVVHPSARIAEKAFVGPLCCIEEGAEIGEATLESHVCVGRNARIGDGAQLYPRVVVADYCEVGPRCRLLQGAVIGADGYGYQFYEGAHQRLPQIGNVALEADVDVGANSTIDRARFGATVVGQGTKIDNQVQVGHNVRIGCHCLLVAQVGVSGSAELGDGVIVAGQAGIGGHIRVHQGAVVAGGAGVTRDVPPGQKVTGMPAESFVFMNRVYALQRKLPELFKRFEALEKNVEAGERRGGQKNL